MQKATFQKSISLVLVALFLVFLAAGFAKETKAAEKSFPSKTITFIIPASPGGGFDTTVRMLVPYLQKYLPNPVGIIVRNMPGGGWMIGIKHTYRAKPDGYTVCIFNMPGNVTHMITGRAEYDLTKITWLGSPAEITYVTALSPKSKYKTLEDLQKAPRVIAGTVGMSSTAALGTILAAEAMGIKMDYIPHDGSTEAILAGIRGDVDWVQYPYGSLKRYLKSGDLVPAWVYAKKRLPPLPDVPTIAELGYEELLAVVTMFRPVGGPPGIPDDVAKVWREAFQKAAQDPELVSAMEKAALEPSYLGPEETAKKVADSVEKFTKYKDVLLKYLK